MHALSISLTILTVACTAPTARPEPPPLVQAHAPDVGWPAVGCKPTAPVLIHATARAVGGGAYDVRVTGTADADIDALALSLVLPPNASLAGGAQAVSYGALDSGQARTLTARVHVSGAGATLHARAATKLSPGLAPARVAELTLGAPPRQARIPVRAIAVGGGERIDEVRP